MIRKVSFSKGGQIFNCQSAGGQQFDQQTEGGQQFG
jgi:hypothetical protein